MKNDLYANISERMSVLMQLESGRLVCPRSYGRLKLESDSLVCEDNCRYPLINGVPFLLLDSNQMKQYLQSNPAMLAAYESAKAKNMSAFARWKEDLYRSWVRGYRTRKSMQARHDFLSGLPHNGLVLSVGGGPYRSHPIFVNVNVDSFYNVDVVADATRLPYASDSVDGIHCDSLLEHLPMPEKAASEMFRVLKKKGQILVVTPFLMQFHGYPHHYQNFTLSGHKFLFERYGFRIIQAGVCVGPWVGMVDRFIALAHRAVPRVIRRYALKPLWFLGELVKPLDRLIRERSWAHELACTTYVYAEKP